MGSGGYRSEGGPVSAGDAADYLDRLSATDEPDLPGELVAELVAAARRELAAGGEPDAVLDRVLFGLSRIEFDVPRRCDCGTVLAERGWRGRADLTCPACGLLWRLKATDTSFGTELLTPEDQLPPVDPVLLIIEEAGWKDAKRRRNRRGQALLAVDDVPAPDDEDRLRQTMGWDTGGFDLERSRYSHVCIVAGESSPIREWVTALFRSTMPTLVAAGGLTVCAPPYDAQRATVVPLEPGTS